VVASKSLATRGEAGPNLRDHRNRQTSITPLPSARLGFTNLGKEKVKDRRKRPEGGAWEPIKISHRNLGYISESN
jgi:hypothetical protein